MVLIMFSMVVSAGRPASQLARRPEPGYGGYFINIFRECCPRAGRLALHPLGEIADQLFGLVGTADSPAWSTEASLALPYLRSRFKR
jgi:hypothetical protein